MQIYVVQQGDTLWGIAQRYNAEINQIILLNQLDNPNALVIGQSLVIPEAGSEYVIQPGDTLWSLSQRFGIPIADLAVYNNITDPALLYVGQMLELPYFAYVVQPGDTVWAVARRYGVTVNEIVQVNNLTDPNVISAGQTLTIPAPDKPVKEVNAYITEFGQAGRAEVLSLGKYLTYISPFTYSIQADGSLTELNESAVLQAAAATNTAPLMVVTNFVDQSFNSDLAATLLRNPQLQETFITNLLNVMREKNYAGVNFDFEYVYPEDRENYNAFLRRVVARLRPEGFIVSTALAPKDTADQPGLLYEAHDYAAHGEIVDFVVVMTYEWGWAGGEPWAIAPINEVREVLDYAVTEIPPEKIMMGVPLYGRDWRIPWVEGTFARTVSPKEAVRLARRYGVPIQYNETYQSPFFTYVDETGQEHEVWFEDARSIQAKYETVEEYGLRGVSYWVLGTPFPENWAALQDNFRIRKL